VKHATEEQQHARQVAERINQLGGTPNFSPEGLATRSASQYTVGANLVGMIRENLIAERIACEHYREPIRFFADKDPTTRVTMESILSKEESTLTICLTCRQLTTVRLVPQYEAVPDQRNILRGKRKRLALHPRIIFTAPKRLHDPCVRMVVASSEQVGNFVHENMSQHIAQKERCRSGRVEAPDAVVEDLDVSAFVCERICQCTGSKTPRCIRGQFDKDPERLPALPVDIYGGAAEHLSCRGLGQTADRLWNAAIVISATSFIVSSLSTGNEAFRRARYAFARRHNFAEFP